MTYDHPSRISYMYWDKFTHLFSEQEFAAQEDWEAIKAKHPRAAKELIKEYKRFYGIVSETYVPSDASMVEFIFVRPTERRE